MFRLITPLECFLSMRRIKITIIHESGQIRTPYSLSLSIRLAGIFGCLIDRFWSLLDPVKMVMIDHEIVLS